MQKFIFSLCCGLLAFTQNVTAYNGTDIATSVLLTVSTQEVPSSDDPSVTETFTVYGNCGMCKKTIEGSLTDVKGVDSANWDKETDEMTVTYDPSVIKLDKIKQKIADVGYDSDTHRAKDKVYNKLPGCCQYDRPSN